MPSEEMLKQLLDEFVEKEALINEELKVVSEQILELENRLGQCNERLKLVSVDRQKVLSMKERYVDALNNLPAPPASATGANPLSSEVKVQSIKEMKSSQPEVKSASASEPKPSVASLEPKISISAIEPKVARQPAEVGTPPVTEPASRLQPETKPAPRPEEITPQPTVTGPKNTSTEPKPSGISSLLGQRGKEAPSEHTDSHPSTQDSIQQAIDSLDGLTPESLPAATAPEKDLSELPAQQVPPPASPLPTAPAATPAQESPPTPAVDTGAPESTVVDLGATEGESDESDSDTVKSINEALRSLFR